MKRFFRRTDVRPNAQRDVDDELRFHLEMRTQEFMEAGMSAEQARLAAQQAFGDVTTIDAERPDTKAEVILGVDTHLDFHVAVAIAPS